MILLCLFVSFCCSEFLYASTDGNNYTCSISFPCKLEFALQNATNGDVVYLMDGVYSDSGELKIPVTLSLEGFNETHGARITGTTNFNITESNGHITFVNLFFENCASPIVILNQNYNNITFSNIKSKNTYVILKHKNNGYVTIRDSYIEESVKGIFLLFPSGLIIEDSIFLDSLWDDVYPVIDIYLPNFEANGDFIIRNCVFKGNKGDEGGAVFIMRNTVFESVPLQIIDSTFENNEAWNYGGAIESIRVDLRIENCTFSNNDAWEGGAILTQFSSLIEVFDSRFFGNYGENGAGAVELWYGDDVIFENCIFQLNDANDVPTNYGGAIWAIGLSTMIVEFSEFKQNFCGTTSGMGGGISCIDVDYISLRNNYFNQNIGFGGAAVYMGDPYYCEILNDYYDDNSAIWGAGVLIWGGELSRGYPNQFLIVENTEFNSNTAFSAGGGLYVISTNVDVDNSTFFENYGEYFGGGMLLESTLDSYVKNCSFLRNFVNDEGGAIEIRNIFYFPSTFMIENTTFSENSASSGGAIFGKNVMSDILLVDCEISSHYALGPGGGIFIRDSFNFSTINVIFVNNNSTDEAGGIKVQNMTYVNFIRTTFEGNTAGLYGGAGHFSIIDNVRIQDSIIKKNNCSIDGGGLYFFDVGDAIIDSSYFENNDASNGHTGALLILNFVNIEVNDCQFSKNFAFEEASSIFFGNGESIMVHGSVFEENESLDKGCVYLSNIYEATFVQSNFSSNLGSHGAGIFIFDERENSVYSIESCFFASNIAMFHGAAIAIQRRGGTAFTETDVHIENSQFERNFVPSNYSEFHSGAIFMFCISNIQVLSSNFIENEVGLIVVHEIDVNSTFPWKSIYVEDSNFFSNNGKGAGLSLNYLDDVKILNSNFWNNTSIYYGAGVLIFRTHNVLIQSCNFWENVAEDAPAIQMFTIYENVTLFKTKIWNNIAVNTSGAVRITNEQAGNEEEFSNPACVEWKIYFGHLTIDECVFEDNTLTLQDPIRENWGGGFSIQQLELVEVKNTNFSRNFAYLGSAFSVTSSEKLVLNNILIEENSAVSDIVYVMEIKEVKFTNSIIRNNIGQTKIYQSKEVEIDGIKMLNNSNSNYPLDQISELHYEHYTGGFFFSMNYDSEETNIQCLKGVTLKNSVFENNIGTYGGAVCFAEKNNILIINCTFIENEAIWGGAVFSMGTHRRVELIDETMFSLPGARVYSSKFISNKGKKGGALFFQGRENRAIVSKSSFDSNEAEWGSSVYILSSIESYLIDNSFTNEVANMGNVFLSYAITKLIRGEFVNGTSCLYVDSGKVNANDILFEGCIDGSIILDSLEQKDSPSILEDITIINSLNQNGEGGGIKVVNNKDPSFEIKDVMIQNCISKFGGAIYLSQNENVTLTNVTMVDCFADFGGSFAFEGTSVILKDDIILQNSNALTGGSIYCDMKTNLEEFTILNSDSEYCGRIISTFPSVISLVSVTSSRNGENLYFNETINIFSNVEFDIGIQVLDFYEQIISYNPNFDVVISLSSQYGTTNLKGSSFIQPIEKEILVFQDITIEEPVEEENIFLIIEIDSLNSVELSVPVSFQFCSPGYFVSLNTNETLVLCKECGKNQYSVVSNSKTCYECPNHCRCYNGNNVTADPGYWSEVSSSGIVSVHYCYNTYCIGNNECSGNRQGPVCASCREGYSEWNGSCTKCGGTSALSIVLYAIFMIVRLIIAHAQSQNDSGIQKIVNFFFQTWTLVFRNVEWVSVIRSIVNYEIISLKRLFPYEMEFEFCPFVRSSYLRFISFTIEPCSFLLCIFCCMVILSPIFIYCSYKKGWSKNRKVQDLPENTEDVELEEKKEEEEKDKKDDNIQDELGDDEDDNIRSRTENCINDYWKRFLKSLFKLFFNFDSYFLTFLALLITTYQTFTEKSVNYFSCVKYNGVYRVNSATDIICGEETYYHYLPVFIIVFLYSFFFPLSVFIFLLIFRKYLKDSPTEAATEDHRQESCKDYFQKLFSSFYQCYKPEKYVPIWFECVALYRRFFFVLIVLLVSSFLESSATEIIITIYLLFWLLVQVKIKPYKNKFDNYLETFSLIVLCLVQLLKSSYLFNDNSYLANLVITIISVPVLIFFLIIYFYNLIPDDIIKDIKEKYFKKKIEDVPLEKERLEVGIQTDKMGEIKELETETVEIFEKDYDKKKDETKKVKLDDCEEKEKVVEEKLIEEVETKDEEKDSVEKFDSFSDLRVEDLEKVETGKLEKLQKDKGEVHEEKVKVEEEKLIEDDKVETHEEKKKVEEEKLIEDDKVETHEEKGKVEEEKLIEDYKVETHEEKGKVKEEKLIEDVKEKDLEDEQVE